MTLCVCGIDPGLRGAVAFYFPEAPDRVGVEDMPVADGEIDAASLARRLTQFNPDFAVVELVRPGKGWGSSQAFWFGHGSGCIRGVLAALQIETHFVSPQVWKRHHGLLRADKEASRAKALQLFAKVPQHFARKKDDGRAEAALIARYGAEVLRPDTSLTRPHTEAA